MKTMQSRQVRNAAIALGSLIAVAIVWNYFWRKGSEQELYKVATPEIRTIEQVVKATGYIEVEDSMRIGSLVPGIIKKMHVSENDPVKKGQLLAEIDDSKEDTEVREGLAAWRKSQAEYAYQCKFFQRQKKLYQLKHISDDEFERTMRDLQAARERVNYDKARYERAKLVFDNKQIKAPDDGLVISKVSREGETVTLASPATLLYTIAKDIKAMEAKIEIDESFIGMIKKGMCAFLTFDAYNKEVFQGKITDISKAPITKSGNVSYTATVPVDNSKLKYFPQMSFDARISVSRLTDIMAVPGYVLKLNRRTIKQVADALGYMYKELQPEERSELSAKGNIETLWVYADKTFTERAVEVGADDYAYYQILSGLEPNEKIVTDIADEDVMKKIFQRFFSSGFGNK